MENILIFLEMIGGLVLFLYGMNELGNSLKKLSGSKLELILEKLTANKWKGAILGMIVTAIIQSSGATIVMVVGFVNSQIMNLSQAVGVILGANVGTTVTAWLLSLTGIQSDNVLMQFLKPQYFSPVFGLIGLILVMGGKKDKQKNIGGILVAFAVLMLGMSGMSSAASPLTQNESFTGILTAFSNPILGLLAGLVMTAVLQSSSASIGILQAIAVGGSMKMSTAIPILMGENIGSAITGVISSIGASRNARRAAMMQMYFCLIKTGVFMVGFYALNAMMHLAIMDKIATPVGIAVFHSVFNIGAVLIMLPISELLVKLVMKTIPSDEQELKAAAGRRTLQILDPHFLSSPAFALEQCRVAMKKMSEHTREAMELAMSLIFTYDPQKAEEVDDLERRVDEYEDTLDSYLVQLSSRISTKNESQVLSTLLHSVIDFERITDHALNIMQQTSHMQENNLQLTEAALDELSVFTSAISDIMNRTFKAFNEHDLELALTVEPLEEIIDGLNMEIKDRHIWRLRHGMCTVETGMILSDITTNLERVADHCSNIAVCLLSMENDSMDTHKYLKHERSEENTDFVREEAEFQVMYKLPAPSNAAAGHVE